MELYENIQEPIREFESPRRSNMRAESIESFESANSRFNRMRALKRTSNQNYNHHFQNQLFTGSPHQHNYQLEYYASPSPVLQRLQPLHQFHGSPPSLLSGSQHYLPIYQNHREFDDLNDYDLR